jgi:hypothetical protein
MYANVSKMSNAKRNRGKGLSELTVDVASCTKEVWSVQTRPPNTKMEEEVKDMNLL